MRLPCPTECCKVIRCLHRCGTSYADVANCDMEDWEKYVNPQGRLLLVGDNVGVMPYLYQDTVISIHSTICTPTYDEKLLEYWEQNPEKEPTVIAMSCWYGEMYAGEDNWIFRWMEDKFGETVYEDGRNWRFYRAADASSEEQE